jgi:hypothetical protein
VIGFHPVVGVGLPTVPRTRSQFNNVRIHRRLVRGDLYRDDFRGGQRTGEETPSRTSISPRGPIHVDDLPELIDRPGSKLYPASHRRGLLARWQGSAILSGVGALLGFQDKGDFYPGRPAADDR